MDQEYEVSIKNILLPISETLIKDCQLVWMINPKDTEGTYAVVVRTGNRLAALRTPWSVICGRARTMNLTQ